MLLRSEQKILQRKALRKHMKHACADMKPNKGGFALQKIGKGAKRN